MHPMACSIEKLGTESWNEAINNCIVSFPDLGLGLGMRQKDYSKGMIDQSHLTICDLISVVIDKATYLSLHHKNLHAS